MVYSLFLYRTSLWLQRYITRKGENSATKGSEVKNQEGDKRRNKKINSILNVQKSAI
jgi:hypothetical protein